LLCHQRGKAEGCLRSRRGVLADWLTHTNATCKYYYKTLITILVILLSVAGLHAQSIFSFYGPADAASQRDVYGEGMGGTGSGDLFRINTGYVNPATSVSQTRAYFSTAISMGNMSYSDGGAVKAADSQFYLPYFNVVFPFKQSRFGFQYQNIASGNLHITSPEFTDPIAESGTLTETQDVKFSLYKAGLFWANRNKYLHFGVGLNYMFGHHITESKQDFSESSMKDSAYKVDKAFRNPMFTLGFAKNFDDVSFGLSANYPLEMKGETLFTHNGTEEDLGKDTIFQYPPSANFGVTYKLSERFYWSLDADYELWGDTNNFENPVNTARIGTGFSWSGIPLSKVFLWKFPMRAGVSYRNLPFQINNNNINEMAYHMGFSIPLKLYDSYLDVAGKLYYRGNAADTKYEENGFLLSIGIKGFDFMRTPPNRKPPREIPRTFDDRTNQRGSGQRGQRPEGEGGNRE